CGAQSGLNADFSGNGTNDSVQAVSSNGTAAVSWTATTATDVGYDDNSLTISYANAAGTTKETGDSFAIGLHVITATATDGASNATTCTFNIRVADTAVPNAITCGAQSGLNADFSGNGTNDSVQAVSSNGTQAVSWTATTATDLGYAANTLTISYANAAGTTKASGDSFAIGAHTITATATDGSSNATTCNFSIRVADTAAPNSITCGAQSGLNADFSGDGTNDAVQATSDNAAVVSWTATSATDAGYAANSLTIAYANAAGTTVASGDSFSIAQHTITATATDGSSNATTCNFNIRVADTAAPDTITWGAQRGLTAYCSGDGTNDSVQAVSSNGTAAVAWTAATATDVGYADNTLTISYANAAGTTKASGDS
ncbi:MAG: HYR domain-containing protein, partial [Verrucomicrobiota bacterium]|nr:HYR domain-containing protein [Verrucomicrobiota bacterium]